MKVLSLSFMLLSLLLLYSFKNKNKDLKFVKIAPNTYMAATEVSNVQYRLFLNDLLQHNRTEAYKQCLYDSAQWASEPLRGYYHRHAA